MPRCFECGERIEGEFGLLKIAVGENRFEAPAHDGCVPEELKDG